jgi:hypothetical protein
MPRKKMFDDNELTKITVRIRKAQKEKIDKHRRKTLKGQDEQVREALDQYFQKEGDK